MLRISDTLKHVSQSISDLIRAAYRCYSNALEKVRMEGGWGWREGSYTVGE